MYREKPFRATSGWPMLVLDILLWLGLIPAIIWSAHGALTFGLSLTGLLFLSALLIMIGFFIVKPNQGVALLLFGAYQGVTRQTGFRWANPFLSKQRVSLRARTLNGDKIKVNDLVGNPIEIAAVVVWQVHDAAQALFEVDEYLEYVTTQSEAAVRHLASAYPYDGDEGEMTLRGATDEINQRLEKELQERLSRAGVTIIESRLSHLAYAPEIAHAMLQRQQASAVVAARQKIVEGAVGMVEMALDELSRTAIIQLDEDRKATMISNLLVVLCSEHAAQPVLNTGTIYQ
jgi:regulator of protease activity HflC (stomatin/prohibitin superfamily)